MNELGFFNGIPSKCRSLNIKQEYQRGVTKYLQSNDRSAVVIRKSIVFPSHSNDMHELFLMLVVRHSKRLWLDDKKNQAIGVFNSSSAAAESLSNIISGTVTSSHSFQRCFVVSYEVEVFSDRKCSPLSSYKRLLETI